MNKLNYLLITLSMVILASYSAIGQGFLPTSLKVTVLDELGNPVENADVVLFKTKEDYQKETNPVVAVQKTNVKGQIKIKDLEPIQYYLHVTFDKKSNIGGGVLTNTLLEGRTNKVNTIIE